MSYDFSKIPISPNDITWSQYNSFRAQEAFYFQLRDSDDIAKEVYCLCEAVSVVCGLDADVLYNDFPLTLANETAEDLKYYTLSIGDQLSVLRLYFHINNLCDLYRPNEFDEKETEFHIEINGEKYYLDNNLWENVMLGNLMLPTIEVVEVMHLQQRFKEAVTAYDEAFDTESQEGVLEDDDGIKIGAGSFMAGQDMLLGQNEAAILLKKKGERLPYKRTLRRKFIEERAKMFGDVPFPKIADMRFFLINMSLKLLLKENIPLFGKESQESGNLVPILYEN